MEELGNRLRVLSPEKRKRLKALLKDKLPTRRFRYDVIILGGGMAGSMLARQLIRTRPGIRILVAEKGTYPVPEAAFKVGESTAELSAHYFGEMLGLKDHLESRHLLKAGLRYFFTFGDNSEITRRMEVGLKDFPPLPGYQIDRGRLENHLFHENTEQGITIWTGCKVESVALDSPHRVKLTRDGEEFRLSTRWVVDATGRAGFLKRRLGLTETVEHDINAVWFRIRANINVADWSAKETWRKRVQDHVRRVSTGHLMGRGYWVWIICLSSEVTSIGIVADAGIHTHSKMNRFERALEWLGQYEPQCARIVEKNRDRLLDFQALKHFAHGCQRVFSAERWCITGDAGVFADPLYSPGSDFIAMSNCLITDLVIRDLDGRPLRAPAEQYNRSYLNLFKRYMDTYRFQYSVPDNPGAMLAKIIWDWAIYWGVTALLFFHGNRMFDWEWIASVSREMHRFNLLNEYMQSFFRGWSEWSSYPSRNEFVSLLDLPFLYSLHTGLRAGHDEEALKTRLAQNVDLLEAIARGMHRRAGRRDPRAADPGEVETRNVLKGAPWLDVAWEWQTNAEVPPELDKIWPLERVQ